MLPAAARRDVHGPSAAACHHRAMLASTRLPAARRRPAYDDVFLSVKAARGVANPQHRLHLPAAAVAQAAPRARGRLPPLYRLAPQSGAAPRYLVAKAVGQPRGASLDPRGAFVLRGPASLAVWVGTACPDAFVAAAHRFAGQLQKYEGAPGPATVVRQGQEPEAFWACLAAAAAAGEGSRSGSPAAGAGAMAGTTAAAGRGGADCGGGGSAGGGSGECCV